MRQSVERRAYSGLLLLATVAALSAPASAWAVQISGCTILPPENPWNRDVSGDPVSTALTSTYVANINQGTNKNLHPDFGTNPLYGIPFVVVSGTQAKVPINFVAYPAESDPGPYPVPPTAPIEGGVNGTGDRHVIVLDKDNALLYEMYNSSYQNPAWNCDSGAIWDMSSNTLRTAGWTSADAGGLPILPGLVRYDEVATGAITHALRFTVPETQAAYVYPATHKGASANTNAPPMGTRLRLKASFDISGYTGQSRIILQALKNYGMINADRGSGWYISGTSDSRWDDNDLNQLKTVPGTAFEVLVPMVTYPLTVNNGAGSGGYPANTPVKITANAPPAGKVFDQWTGATVANAFSAVTTIATGAAAASVTATYKTPTSNFTLTVTSGSGSGTYAAGTVVTITANAPPAGQIFKQWTGATVANANASTTTITMPAANTTVTATYQNTYTLTVTSGSGSGTYIAGAVVTITANAPPAGQIFKQWTGATVANANASSTTITMPAANTAVTATYQNTYTLTVTSGSGSGTYIAGAVVTITANAPPAGQVFNQWTGATVANASASSTTITMPAANTAVTATYKIPTYTLTVTSGSGGGTYSAGTVVTITANAPPAGQIFKQWTGATVANANASSTTITMPAANTTVTATYQNTYTLTVTSGSGGGTYIAGAVITITANAPPAGQVFNQWTGATVANANASTTTITMPAANTAVTATYKAGPTFTLTVVSGSGSGSFGAGNVVAIVANAPPAGQVFDQWTGATVASATSASTTLTMPASNVTVTATYKAVLYTLTVTGGSGSGSYAAGTSVSISANAPPSGMVFDQWTGASVGNAQSASTLITMPAASTALTATFKAAPPPVLSSGPTATPNPAVAGQAVQFACVDNGSGPFTWSWNFGDGASDATSGTVSHTYAAAGTFAVSVTVTDAFAHSSSGALSLVVQPGGASKPGDGSGITDQDKIDAGLDPTNSAAVLTVLPLTIKALKGKLNLTRANSDTIRVQGSLSALPANFTALGTSLTLTVGSARVHFTLDAKGRGKSANGLFALKLKTRRNKTTHKLDLLPGAVVFQANLSKGSWNTLFNAQSVSAASTQLSAHVGVIVPATRYGGDSVIIYSAKKGTGNFTLKK